MLAYLPIVFMIIGLLLYLAPMPTKLSEIGRLTYFAGILVLVLQYAGRSVRLL